MKKVVLGLILLSSQAFGIFVQAYGRGIDFNDAILGCLRSSESCLANTGINFIDQFFREAPHRPYTREDECRDLKTSWCTGGTGSSYDSGFFQCLDARKTYYRHKNGDIKNHDRNYFVCTAKQRELYMKARCGVDYMDWRYLPSETLHCEDDDED